MRTTLSVALLTMAWLVQPFGRNAQGADSAEPTAEHVKEATTIFNQRCTACHTFGKGVKVGPDLKGVTDRRTRPWLLHFVRGSSTVIASGDPTATALFQQFKQQRMPDWSDLSEEQVGAIMDWFSVDGPEHQQSPDERLARLASPAEIEVGRALFAGDARLASGGIACHDCHAIAHGWMSWTKLGPSLTGVYSRYQDRALTAFLKTPCFPRSPDSSASTYLQPEEIFAIKAYLRYVAVSNNGKGAQP